MSKKSLWERCEISSNKDKEKFVGIRVKDNDIKITFPMGYNLVKSDDKTIRKEILSLLSILNKFNKKESSEENFMKSKKSALELPIYSYQYLILDYFSNGYYREKEVSYSSSNKGKINWKRTIQKKNPILDGGNAVYLDFIVKKNIVKLNSILTRIHEYCIYESFIKIGWLYSDILPIQPRIKLNKKMFITVINEVISQTFDDNKNQLFIAMRNIINNANEGDISDREYSYGTHSFEYIWERMIDYVFGEPNKKVYFPKARWSLVGKCKSIESSSLQPDTILRFKDKIFIIDAKYYKYGITDSTSNSVSNLPASSSIQKQITYGEYLTSGKFEEVYGSVFSQDCIYNAFVMPFNKEKDGDDEYKFVGIATADWKDSEKQYENVVGLLLDTKHLVDNCYKKNYREIEKISNMIVNVIKTYNFE